MSTLHEDKYEELVEDNISKKDLDQLREIKPTDTTEIIDKKIKACFCPPHHGAYITLKDKQYSIVNSEILNNIIQYGK